MNSTAKVLAVWATVVLATAIFWSYVVRILWALRPHASYHPW